MLSNPWLPTKPHPKQAAFLLASNCLEALFGGAAGGGKSEALLMAAAQYVEVPGYSALLLRKSFRDLMQPDALIPRSKAWWMGTDATWSALDKRWTFPSGATLTFGYLEHADDVYQYQGAAFQFVGFDELTQFDELPYRYLFSRLRKAEGAVVPLRMRGASNPGNKGHFWVKKRFISNATRNRLFFPSRLEDNPSLDYDEYVQSLSELDPVTRAQLLAGDWDAYEGGQFHAEWFRPYVRAPHEAHGWVYRYNGKEVPCAACYTVATVDPAASERDLADYTAVVVFAVVPESRDLLVLDVVRERMAVDRIVPRVADLCRRWHCRLCGIESAGFQTAIYDAAKQHPHMPPVKALFPEGKGKLVRATPAIIRAEAGQIYVPEFAPWLEDFLGELTVFTGDEDKDSHDDQVDALGYGVALVEAYPALIQGELPADPEPIRYPALRGEPDERNPLQGTKKTAPWEAPRPPEPRRRRLFGRGN